MRARKPSALTIRLKIDAGHGWRPQLCHPFGSANWPISKPPRPNFYDNSCTDLVNPSRPAYSAPADDPARARALAPHKQSTSLKSGNKMRVIPVFHRSNFEVDCCDFCFEGRRLIICLICAGVLPRTS